MKLINLSPILASQPLTKAWQPVDTQYMFSEINSFSHRIISLRLVFHLLFLLPPSHIVIFIWKYLGCKTIIKWKNNPVKKKLSFQAPSKLSAIIYKHSFNTYMSKETSKAWANAPENTVEEMAQNYKQFNQVSCQKNMPNEYKGSLQVAV